MIDAEIRNQAYQFFVEEAPELLQIIEAGLLTLIEERTPATVHELMRAAHSIKGGAASVGLDEIQFIAHRLEDIFKALYCEELVIDTELESLLLKAFDCLSSPLTKQITTGKFDAELALATANSAFTQVEERLGDYLTQMDGYIPSTSDLGVDMVSSLFEVDVAQGLERLASVIATPQAYEVAGELRALSEVFAGFAEMLSLPGFGEIAQTTLAALDTAPDRALEIAQLAQVDFAAAREAVLAGDRTRGGSPSEALIAISQSAQVPLLENLEEFFFSAEDSLEAEVLEEQPLDFAIDPASLLETDPKPAEPIEALPPLLSDLAPNSDAENRDEQGTPEPKALFPFLSDLAPNSDAENRDEQGTPEPTEALPPLLSTLAPNSSSENRDVKGSLVPTHSLSHLGKEARPTKLTVRVDLDRLERMNNLIGELVINRNSLTLQNEQLRATVQELKHRFDRFENLTGQLREFSDKLLVAPMSTRSSQSGGFDALEMDSYGTIHDLLQGLVEDIKQLREAADDIALYAQQSDKTLGQQRQNLTKVGNELMQARMFPLNEVLQRFPRIVRELATEYHKPVSLVMNGTDVLVDKGVLEKLYDPLLHLLRNAYAHGIEPPEVRRQQGKPAQGRIEIRAYRRGNQTLIEIEDDGQGINFDKIARRVLEKGWLSPEQLRGISQERLLDFIFEPGFSTASQVTELAGRGVGLDVVQEQLRALKGTINITSSPGKGTTFTLRLPLTLTIAKLLVCSAGAATVAIPTNSIEEIVVPKAGQIREIDTQRFLHWREQVIPVEGLADRLDYPGPWGRSSSVSISLPEAWSCPLLVLEGEQQPYALEIERLGPEQELVIKPFGAAIAPPSYVCGCTVLGDGSLVPVIDTAALIQTELRQKEAEHSAPNRALTLPMPLMPTQAQVPLPVSAPTILVIDDSATIRQSLVLTLQKAGYRVLQAGNGWEALEQLRHGSQIDLAICDVEMPKMNGFEFLSQLRSEPQTQVRVVMLTSRGSDKHRQLAAYLGATAYFTKPYLEQEFLGAISNILGETLPRNISSQSQVA